MPRSAPPTPSPARAEGRPVATWRRVARIGVGVALTLLGLLWVLQGADLVRIEPVGCVAECEPVTGGSPAWLTIGVIALLGGLFLLGAPRLLGAGRRR